MWIDWAIFTRRPRLRTIRSSNSCSSGTNNRHPNNNNNSNNSNSNSSVVQPPEQVKTTSGVGAGVPSSLGSTRADRATVAEEAVRNSAKTSAANRHDKVWTRSHRHRHQNPDPHQNPQPQPQPQPQPAFWERLPTRTVSIRPAEVLTVRECLRAYHPSEQHPHHPSGHGYGSVAELYNERDQPVRITGIVADRSFVPATNFKCECECECECECKCECKCKCECPTPTEAIAHARERASKKTIDQRIRCWGNRYIDTSIARWRSARGEVGLWVLLRFYEWKNSETETDTETETETETRATRFPRNKSLPQRCVLCAFLMIDSYQHSVPRSGRTMGRRKTGRRTTDDHNLLPPRNNTNCSDVVFANDREIRMWSNVVKPSHALAHGSVRTPGHSTFKPRLMNGDSRTEPDALHKKDDP